MVGAVDAEVKDASGGTVSFQPLAGEAGLYVPAGLWLVLRAAPQGRLLLACWRLTRTIRPTTSVTGMSSLGKEVLPGRLSWW